MSNDIIDFNTKMLKFAPILTEQVRQLSKWGMQNHDPSFWHLILSEEMGEVAEAILKTVGEGHTKNWHDVIEELVQVQAVAQSMIESIKRNQIIKTWTFDAWHKDCGTPIPSVQVRARNEYEASEIFRKEHPGIGFDDPYIS